MMGFNQILKFFHKNQFRKREITLYRCYHPGSNMGFDPSRASTSTSQNAPQSRVAILWDLDNKPPKSIPPFDAAVRLKKAVGQFGVVRYMVAFANRHAFSYVPPEVREQRKERKTLNQLENKGIVKPDEPYKCGVCGRKFYTNERLLNHFKQLHEREQVKRLNQIESARGTRRVKLVGKFSMKMEKYKSVAKGVLTPKVGYGLADDIKRAGFWVKAVSDKPQAADIALREHLTDMMDRRQAECVVIVSDDSDFIEILKEAKLRCLKTVVVGDSKDGALKRVADAGFSWAEIMRGKAKKEAVSVAGRWKDRDVLKKLEWSYDPERDRKLYGLDDEFDAMDWDSESISSGEDSEGFSSGKDDNSLLKENMNAWWELESDTESTCS